MQHIRLRPSLELEEADISNPYISELFQYSPAPPTQYSLAPPSQYSPARSAHHSPVSAAHHSSTQSVPGHLHHSFDYDDFRRIVMDRFDTATADIQTYTQQCIAQVEGKVDALIAEYRAFSQ